MRIQLLSLIGSCVIFSSCCSPGIRPEDANLFQAVCGMAFGDFERQVESDRKMVVLSQHKLEAQQANSASLETDLENQKAKRDRLLLDLADVENQNRQLEAEAHKMREDSAKAQQARSLMLGKLRRVQSQLADLKSKILIERQAYKQHQAEISRLKREVETLRMIISIH